MDPSTISNYSNLTATPSATEPGELVHDPLWAAILRWVIGGIIIIVGKSIFIIFFLFASLYESRQ